LSINYDSTTILLQILYFITEKCLQNSATFGTGQNPYFGGHRTSYLSLLKG
jgi:hypothetical protein